MNGDGGSKSAIGVLNLSIGLCTMYVIFICLNLVLFWL